MIDSGGQVRAGLRSWNFTRKVREDEARSHFHTACTNKTCLEGGERESKHNHNHTDTQIEESNGKGNIRQRRRGEDGDSKMGICLGKAGQVREVGNVRYWCDPD